MYNVYIIEILACIYTLYLSATYCTNVVGMHCNTRAVEARAVPSPFARLVVVVVGFATPTRFEPEKKPCALPRHVTLHARNNRTPMGADTHSYTHTANCTRTRMHEPLLERQQSKDNPLKQFICARRRCAIRSTSCCCAAVGQAAAASSSA